MKEIIINKIATMRSDFKEKFGIPRQSGLVNSLVSYIVFEPEYRNKDALRGLEDFSHIWILWQFSECSERDFSPTVRPPRLGGNKRMGVFATRSPFRPNHIGMSSVKIKEIIDTPNEGTIICVEGADLMDGTPILDIKPYIPHVDIHEDALGGFSTENNDYELEVVISDELLKIVQEEKREALLGVLSQDPRPAYADDKDRIYGMRFAEYEVKFQVIGKKLSVNAIKLYKK